MYFQYQQSLPPDTLLVGTPDPADLVSISQVPTHPFFGFSYHITPPNTPLLNFYILQSRCSASDLLRMEAILASKLECSSSQQGMPVTPLSFLRVMSAVSRAAAARLEVLFPSFSFS